VLFRSPVLCIHRTVRCPSLCFILSPFLCCVSTGQSAARHFALSCRRSCAVYPQDSPLPVTVLYPVAVPVLCPQDSPLPVTVLYPVAVPVLCIHRTVPCPSLCFILSPFLCCVSTGQSAACHCALSRRLTVSAFTGRTIGNFVGTMVRVR
jgi:hypothetical protein